MRKTKLFQEKLVRLPILIFTIITPLLFIFSLGNVFASPPTAFDDAYTTNEDEVLIITATTGVLSNDNDVGNGVAILETAPLTGNVELASSGAFTYTPLLNHSGIITFSYYVSKTGEFTDVANVEITVNAVNDAPTADDDNATTPEDTAVSIPVLVNDNDIDGSLDPSSITILSGPVSGTTGINLTTGAITYTPTLNFNGNDSFVYQVYDDGIPAPTLSVTATVYLTVTAVNDAPTATDDSDTTDEDTAVTIDVLANDDDVDGDTLSVDSVTQGTNGSVVNNTTDVTYTPNANYCGPDSFTYTVSDGNGGTDTATVNVTITCVNDAPVAADDSDTTNEDTAVIIDVLANDNDIDGSLDLSSVTILATPTNGTTGVNLTTGAVTYTPTLNFNGNDSFVYQVFDDGIPAPARSVTATVSLTVTAVNDAPTAADDSDTTNEDTAVTIDVLANDDDSDGSLDLSSVTIVTAPVNGTTGVNLTTGAITYTPTLNFNGNDSFVYQVFDDGIPAPARSVTATVYLTVTAVNDAPTATDDSNTTNEDTAITIDVLANDDDVDGDTLSVDSVTQGTNGSVVNNTTDVTYTPNANYCGADSFTYTVSDGNSGTDTATVNVTITCINDDPVAANDSDTTNEDTAVIIDVLANDNDVDEDALSVDSVTQGTNGSVVNDTTDVTYTPNANYCGPDSFTYTVSDGNGGTDTATVNVTITCINDAPVLDNSGNLTLTNIDEDDTNNGGTVISSILSSDSSDPITDVDSGAMEGIAIVGATNINGTWQYSLDGNNWSPFDSVSDFNAVLLDTDEYIRFVPNTNYNGSAGTISFRAWDQTAGSSGDININVSSNGLATPYSVDTETATLTVLSVNDAPVLDNSSDLFLTSIGEDNYMSPGDLVAAIIASTGGNRITDVDSGDEEGIAVIGVDNSHGTWQYSINGGLNWSSLNGSPTSATLLNSQSRVRFVPQPNYFGTSGNITFRAWDLSSGTLGATANASQNGGTTAFSTAIETANLNVYSINDAPFLDLNGGGIGNTDFSATFTEDGAPVRIVDTDLSISDVENDDLASAQAVLTNPYDGAAESLTINTGTTGITAVYYTFAGILSLTGPAPLDDFQTVLRTLSYVNSSQNPDTRARVVQVRVNDGTDNSNTATSYVTVKAVNDAPILVNNITLPVNEGGSATISVSRLQVTDVDNTAAEIIYTVITPPSHGDILLSGTPLTTNDTFTQADINGSDVDYDHDASEFGSDSFTFTVSDSSGGTIGVTTFNISVNANNDSPQLAVNAGLSLDENATSTITSSQLTVTDADNTAGQLTYRLEVVPANGNLLLNSTPLLVNDTFTQADINSNKLAYAHDGSETSSDKFTFAVEDGSGGSIDSTPFAITINPVNDAPSVDLNGTAAGVNFAADFTEDDGSVPIADSESIVFDADNVSLLSATAVLANRPDGTAESLSANTNGTNILASYNPATGVLALTGIDSVSNYQTVLRSLQYNNAAQDPTVTNRTVNVTVNDGSAGSNVAASIITIHAVNDLPVLSANAGLTVDYGQTGVINNSLLRITDIDNSVSELVYTVKSLPVNGQLKRNGTALAVNGTFTQADINGGLLAYTHNKTNTESDSFQFTAVDSSGGSISQKTFAIVIHPQPIVYLPVILNNYIYSEPNDSACESFGVTFNNSYQFLPDDTEDWYKFTLNTTSNIGIQISNYASVDGQMIVYSGSNCASIVQIRQLPNITPGGSITLPSLAAGTYYVRVYTAVIPTNPPPYTLLVTKP